MIKYDIDKLFFMKRLNNKGKYTLEEIIIKYDLTKFDFIYKASDQFRRIYYDEFINEKYSVYYFSNEDYTDHLKILSKIGIKFFKKPLPDIKYLKKIKIK